MIDTRPAIVNNKATDGFLAWMITIKYNNTALKEMKKKNMLKKSTTDRVLNNLNTIKKFEPNNPLLDASIKYISKNNNSYSDDHWEDIELFTTYLFAEEDDHISSAIVFLFYKWRTINAVPLLNDDNIEDYIEYNIKKYNNCDRQEVRHSIQEVHSLLFFAKNGGSYQINQDYNTSEKTTNTSSIVLQK